MSTVNLHPCILIIFFDRQILDALSLLKNESSSDPTLPAPWVEVTADGKTYFFNPVTNGYQNAFDDKAIAISLLFASAMLLFAWTD